ncbi:blue copper protein 1a-like [Curcuma longa]|uniref:blue copper protein 1a-like n=1 Tax=Curcuma longa TaxID=136217 RepID=UPI003D9FAC9A
MGLRVGPSLMIRAAAVLLLASFTRTAMAARIIVGDDAHWTFGYNYTDWAIRRAPFYQNDTLVFMYDAPNSTTFPHNVYLMRNFRRYLACNLRNATLLANVVQGVGSGFEYVLRKRKRHYFVCGEHDGLHCTAGMMKFAVHPLKRCHAA